MAWHQDTKTGRTAPDLRKTFNIRRTSDLRRTLNIRRTSNIRKILLPLDDRSGTHRVSRMARDLARADRPVLDAEEATVSLSTNAKGLRILFSKDLYIYLIEEDW